jgi:hypothetical protein
MSGQGHTAGLRRGYADNLRVEWERRGKSGYSSIALLNRKGWPVAVLLGDYIPGEIDPDMEAAANLFCAAPDLLEAGQTIAPYLGATDANDWGGLQDDDALSMTVKVRVGDLRALRAAIAKATDGST